MIHEVVVAVLPGEGKQGVAHAVQPVKRIPDGGLAGAFGFAGAVNPGADGVERDVQLAGHVVVGHLVAFQVGVNFGAEAVALAFGQHESRLAPGIRDGHVHGFAFFYRKKQHFAFDGSVVEVENFGLQQYALAGGCLGDGNFLEHRVAAHILRECLG